MQTRCQTGWRGNIFFVDDRTNIIPTMGLDQLIEGYHAIMQQIYSPGKYYQRVRSFLKELKMPVVRTPTDLQLSFQLKNGQT